jgi:hypothetical protein
MNITESAATTQRTVPIKDVAGSLLDQAYKLADMYVVMDIETNGVSTTIDGQRHYDVRPWLDPHEQPGEFIDMATAAITYAAKRGLVTRHFQQPHMLRVQRFANLAAG